MISIGECTRKYPDLKKIPVAECRKCTLWKLKDDNNCKCCFGEDYVKTHTDASVQVELA